MNEKQQLLELIENLKQAVNEDRINDQLLKDYFMDIETTWNALKDVSKSNNNITFEEGQQVYCTTTHENVFIKSIGESSYFCVKSLEDSQGFYYSKYELR